MPDILLQIIAFIILIGVLVFIHELGHFLAARWNGMRAEVFAVGMGPRVMGWNKLTGFTFGRLPNDLELEEHTDYRISALPIGGYVKILGMVDESMDTDFESKEPEPYEFRSKKTWQKAIVLSAGVMMNFILAILLFGALKFFHGETLYDTTSIGPIADEGSTAVAYNAGLRPGDKVMSINGQPVEYYQDIVEQVYIRQAGEDIELKIERDGMPMRIGISRDDIPANPAREGYIVVPDNLGIEIRKVLGASPAYEAGIEPGDVVVALDGRPVGSPGEFIEYVTDHQDESIALTVKRNGSERVVTAEPDDDGKLGVHIETFYSGPTTQRKYGLAAALAGGAAEVWDKIALMGELVGDLFAGKQEFDESVAGPVEIFKMAGQTFSIGPIEFLSLMAYLSVMLAVLNILPIPALDGGHLVFVLIEGITRKEVPLKVRLAAQQVGFLLLIGFMIFVIYNDFARM